MLRLISDRLMRMIRKTLALPKRRLIRLIADIVAAAAAFTLYFALCYRAWGYPYALHEDTRLYGSLLAALTGSVPLAFGRYAYTASFLLAFLLGVQGGGHDRVRRGTDLEDARDPLRPVRRDSRRCPRICARLLA